jgi:FAD/FMN-containing dehydrogenase
MLRASGKDNQDFFWAIRGGGGNFGVVTQFEFNLHPSGPPTLFAGLMVYPFKQAEQVLTQYREFVALAPVKLNVWGGTAPGAAIAKFVVNVHGRWEGAERDDKCIAWSRAFFNAAAPYASSGAYVHFMTADESERITAAYGTNYARLLEIKQRYDPENIFHFNQNIRASKQAGGAMAKQRSA